MIRECMDLCLEGELEDTGVVPEPKMSTLAEATEWFRELMSYELDGETEEDRAFNEDDLHVEMIEVEVGHAQSPRANPSRAPFTPHPHGARVPVVS